jgi:hypothetical protein
VYAAAGIGAALVVAHGTNWRHTLRVLAEFAAALVALMSPYVLFVVWSEGLGEHLHGAIEFAKGEAHQRFIAPPAFPFWANVYSPSWSRMDSAVFLFYAAHALAILCLVLLGRSKGRPNWARARCGGRFRDAADVPARRAAASDRFAHPGCRCAVGDQWRVGACRVMAACDRHGRQRHVNVAG